MMPGQSACCPAQGKIFVKTLSSCLHCSYLVSPHFLAAVWVQHCRLPVQFAVHIVPLLHLGVGALLHGLPLQDAVLVYPRLHGAAGVEILGGPVQPPRHVAPLLLVSVMAGRAILVQLARISNIFQKQKDCKIFLSFNQKLSRMKFSF